MADLVVSVFEAPLVLDIWNPPILYVDSFEAPDVAEPRYNDLTDPARALPGYLRFYPIHLVKNERVFSRDVLARIKESIIKILDADGNILFESSLVKDRVPLIATIPFVGTPDKHRFEPWLFLQLTFTSDPSKNFLLTVGEDIVLTKPSGTELLFEGRILDDIRIERTLGEELSGSVVFPDASFTVDNSDNAFQFLLDTPSLAYSGVVNIWRWDSVNQVLVDEYAGFLVDFTPDSLRANFVFAPIGRSFVDRLIPQSFSGDEDFDAAAREGVVLGRFFGRNINVSIPSVSESAEGQPAEFVYFAGYGRNLVTVVRRDSEVVPQYPVDTAVPADGWEVQYDAINDFTKVIFRRLQDTFSGGNARHNITADVEGLSLPYKNLLISTNALEPSTWIKNNVTVLDNLGYAFDSSKRASIVIGDASQADAVLKNTFYQAHTLANTVTTGLFCYAIVKTPLTADMGVIQNVHLTPAGTNLDVTTNVVLDIFIPFAGNQTVGSSNYLYGTVPLISGWYLLWAKTNLVVRPGSAQIRIRQHAGTNMWFAGAYMAEGNSLTTGAGSPTSIPIDDVGRHFYQEVHAANEGDSRSFAMNIRELLLDSRYGYGQLQADVESFERAAWETFTRGIFCDGPLNENTQGKLILDDLLTPSNARLEVKTVFRSFHIYNDNDRNASVLDFGIGDDRGLGNIDNDPRIVIKPPQEYPKSLIFNTSPVRDNAGSLIAFRRHIKREERDIDFGRIISIANRFIRYERSADIVVERIKKKLVNGTLIFSITTTDPAAWNLNLDDVVTLYIPHKGVEGLQIEITALDKGVRSVFLRGRTFSAETYTYEGLSPIDRDGDKAEFELRTGAGGRGGVGNILSDLGDPGGTASIPPAGYAKFHMRRTAGSSGQEIIAVFADGSYSLIARSDIGSPGKIQGFRVVEDVDDLYTFGSAKAFSFKNAYIINSVQKPEIIINGVTQKLFLITGGVGSPGPDMNTYYDSVNLHTFDQKVEINSDYDLATDTIKVIGEVPLDFTAQIFVSVETSALANIHRLLKDSGTYLRGVYFESLDDRWGSVRCGLAAGEPYFYVLNRNEPTSSGRLGGKKGVIVRRYNKYGYSAEEDYYKYYLDVEDGVPVADAPATTIPSGNFAMTLDQSSLPYVCHSINGNSYLLGGADFQVSATGTNLSFYNITDVLGSATVTAIAWDTNRNELHVCASTQEVFIFDSSLNYTGIFYTHSNGYIINYTYEPIKDEFFAVLNSNVLGDGTAFGVQIFGPTGGDPKSPLRNLISVSDSIKDILPNADGFCYYLFGTSTTLKLGVINTEVLRGTGFSEGRELNSNVSTMQSATSRAFLCLHFSKQSDLTQIT